MIQILRILIVISVLPIAISFGQIQKHYEDFYYSNSISASRCGQNINRFIQYLDLKGEYDPRMKVIYFEAPNNSWGFYKIVGLNSRWGKKMGSHYQQNWEFHVVAELDGKIYDFSFDKRPRVVGVREYFNEMLVPKVPLALYGESFRIRGEGPYYTPERGRIELENHEFKIIHTYRDGSQRIIQDELNYSELLDVLSRD